jgi:hypothetical protein
MRVIAQRAIVLGVVLGLVTVAGVSSAKADLARASSRLDITSLTVTVGGGSVEPSQGFSWTMAYMFDADGSDLADDIHDGFVHEGQWQPALSSHVESLSSDHDMAADASVTTEFPYASSAATVLTPGFIGHQAWGTIWNERVCTVPSGAGSYSALVQLNYVFDYSVYTEPGLNVAMADARVSLTLNGESGNNYYWREFWLDELGVGFSENGEDNDSSTIVGFLLADVTVPAGEILSVGYDAWTMAAVDAEVVPVPGAVLLGSLGLSLASWRLRRPGA